MPDRVALARHDERRRHHDTSDDARPYRPAARDDLGRPPFRRAYGFALLTAALFLLAWVAQFVAQLLEVRSHAEQHGQPFQWSGFFPQLSSATFENWQSEFLRLVWRAVGLALFLCWGSSQSKESDERIEAKLDRLLAERGIEPDAVSREVNSRLSRAPGS